MDLMPTTLHWFDIVIRLALSVLAGTLVGFNRGESGKVAGLRTTLLVCLAACLAMLQVNALLAQAGKQPGSFAVLDLMRLPLGILSGVGFIGAGTILRQDGLVIGVTTAATLWFVTVIGLCLGGGQLLLGMSGLALGMVVLWGFEYVERRMSRQKTALLTVEYDGTGACRQKMIERLRREGCRISTRGFQLKAGAATVEERFDVHWRGSFDTPSSPPFTESAMEAGALSVCWTLVR